MAVFRAAFRWQRHAHRTRCFRLGFCLGQEAVCSVPDLLHRAFVGLPLWANGIKNIIKNKTNKKRPKNACCFLFLFCFFCCFFAFVFMGQYNNNKTKTNTLDPPPPSHSPPPHHHPKRRGGKGMLKKLSPVSA